MKKSFVLFAAMIAAFLGFTASAHAQFPGALKYATTSAAVVPRSVSPGGRATLIVTVKVMQGFHINANKPNDPDLIPTTVTLTSASTLHFGQPIFPASLSLNAPSLSSKPLLVYVGTAKIRVAMTVAKGAKPGSYPVQVAVGYQGCNTSSCFPPKTDNLNAAVLVH